MTGNGTVAGYTCKAHTMHAHTPCMHTHHACTHTTHAHTPRMHTHHACTHTTHAHTPRMHTHTLTTSSYQGKNNVLTLGSLPVRIPAIGSFRHTMNSSILSSSSPYVAISVLKLTVLREPLLSVYTFSLISNFSLVQMRLFK